MTHPVVPPPRTVAVELVGGPMCGAQTIAPLGPDGLPPPVMPTPHGGRYLRADHPVRAHTGRFLAAYRWRPGTD